MENILQEILKQGGFAIIAALAFWFSMRKDKQCTMLYDRLEQKSEKYLEQNIRLQKELNTTISALVKELEEGDSP